MRPPLIIGGGPAGCAAALTLRQANQPVMLLERSTGPADKVCGDFLGAAAIRQSEAFGLDPAALGARPITRLRLVHRTRVTESSLPFRAFGLSRRVFDEALLRRVAEAGADIIRGHAAAALRQDGADLVVRADRIGDIASGAVFLATGKQDLPGHARLGQSVTASGMKTYVRLRRRQQAAVAGHAELFLFRGGYACLLPVEEDRAAFCLLLSDHRRRATWPALLDALAERCPHLAMRLEGAAFLLDQPLSLTGLPFGFVHRPGSTDHDGFFRLGDQAALIPSLAADGVSIAMRSGVRAGQTWLGGLTAGDYHRRLRAMLWPRMRFGAMLSRGIEATQPRQILAPAPEAEPDGLSIAGRWTQLQA